MMVASRQDASEKAISPQVKGANTTEEVPAADAAAAEGSARARALRKFGLVVGGVFAALALVLVLRHRFNHSFQIFTTAATILIVLALVAPTRLDLIERIWMKVGTVMGWFNTRVLLTAVFFVVLTPVSLLLRLIGRDPLKRRFDRQATSYWEKKSADGTGAEDSRGADESVAERYKRQY